MAIPFAIVLFSFEISNIIHYRTIIMYGLRFKLDDKCIRCFSFVKIINKKVELNH